MKKLLLLLLFPALASAQPFVGSYPTATSPLTGGERLLGAQGTPTVNVLASQLAQYITSSNGPIPTLVAGECLGNNGTTLAWVTCGGGGGASTFDQLGSGTNITATMVVGTGATLSYTGSGSISATTALSLTGTPSQCGGGQFALGISQFGNANCGTPTGSGTVNAGTIGQFAVYASSGTAVSGQTGTGTGTPMLNTGPTFTLPGFATASLPTCNSGSKAQLAYTTDGTPAFTFCNGTSWISNGGTTFTITPTGCTPSAFAGSATAGQITLAAGPCTQIVVTMNGAVGMTAPNGWHCNVGDPTALNAGTWIPQWGESSSTTTTATLPIPAAAGATNTITFACTQY